MLEAKKTAVTLDEINLLEFQRNIIKAAMLPLLRIY